MGQQLVEIDAATKRQQRLRIATYDTGLKPATRKSIQGNDKVARESQIGWYMTQLELSKIIDLARVYLDTNR